MYSVVKDFNELSQNIRHLVLSCYKSELRQHLLSAQAMYRTGVSLIVVWIFFFTLCSLDYIHEHCRAT